VLRFAGGVLPEDADREGRGMFRGCGDHYLLPTGSRLKGVVLTLRIVETTFPVAKPRVFVRANCCE
jgi:hypothetical protein